MIKKRQLVRLQDEIILLVINRRVKKGEEEWKLKDGDIKKRKLTLRNKKRYMEQSEEKAHVQIMNLGPVAIQKTTYE